MVQGSAKFKRRMRVEIPRRIRAEVEKTLEKAAAEVVREMELFNPSPGDIRIDWTWGAAPDGAETIGSVAESADDDVRITIYATGPLLPDARVPISLAKIFEFGSRARRQRSTGRFTGTMPASPYFYPVWRANRRRVRARVTRAVRRAFRNS